MEIKLIRLALDPSAQIGEVQNASIMFFSSLRKRGVTFEGFAPGASSKPGSVNTARPKQQQQSPGITMPFGKHRGKELDDIEPDYLRWVYNKWYPGLNAEGQKSWQWLLDAIENYFEETGERL